MPLVHVALRQGKPPAFRRALADGICQALVEAYHSSPQDRFVTIDEYPPESLVFDRFFSDGDRSDDFMLITIVSGTERTSEVKRAFYKRLVDNLQESLEVRPQDVFVRLSFESAYENWSFGDGVPASDLLGALCATAPLG